MSLPSQASQVHQIIPESHYTYNLTSRNKVDSSVFLAQSTIHHHAYACHATIYHPRATQIIKQNNHTIHRIKTKSMISYEGIYTMRERRLITTLCSIHIRTYFNHVIAMSHPISLPIYHDLNVEINTMIMREYHLLWYHIHADIPGCMHARIPNMPSQSFIQPETHPFLSCINITMVIDDIYTPMSPQCTQGKSTSTLCPPMAMPGGSIFQA